ncbi:MAG: hypothetical protein LUH05_00030 [Candidatus Gastranaerophilales bacterium]|nr:hypothetical protein [Candidatus Gastranaerophilales bacterium]
MRIVLVGYGEMFRSLADGVLNSKHELAGVFRHENVLYSPFMRFFHDIISPTEDYNYVKSHNLYDIKADSVNSKKFQNELLKLKPDIIIVGSWSEKFCVQTINIPQIACINVHPSLLPQYRGPNPYIRTILNNEKQSGVTFHLMDVNYDTGSILHQVPVEIFENDTGASLKLKCCNIAKKEIGVLLSDFEQKYENRVSQDEKQSTYYPQISLSESIIDFTKETSFEIDRRIRALKPWLNCHICFGNEFFTFKNYKIYTKISDKLPSTIVKKTDNSLFIVCKDSRVIEFISLKIKRPFSNQLTKYFLNKIIKVNDRVS